MSTLHSISASYRKINDKSDYSYKASEDTESFNNTRFTTAIWHIAKNPLNCIFDNTSCFNFFWSVYKELYSYNEVYYQKDIDDAWDQMTKETNKYEKAEKYQIYLSKKINFLSNQNPVVFLFEALPLLLEFLMTELMDSGNDFISQCATFFNQYIINTSTQLVGLAGYIAQYFFAAINVPFCIVGVMIGGILGGIVKGVSSVIDYCTTEESNAPAPAL